jgi:hypothetical protein
MNDHTYDRIREATRLTRQGKLAEATALLSGGAGRSPGPPPGSASDRQPFTAPTGAFDWKAGEMPDLSRLKSAWARTGGTGKPRGEPKLPKGAQLLAGVHTEAAGSRAYRLYVPSRYDGTAMPLVVMLHGCTQDPVDFALGTRMNERAEDAGCFIAYPEQPASATPRSAGTGFERRIRSGAPANPLFWQASHAAS